MTCCASFQRPTPACEPSPGYSMATVTPVEQRQIRLRNDYATMENIRTPWLNWKALKGTVPLVEEYEIDLRLRTIIDSRPTYRDRHVIRVTLGPSYPLTSAPWVQMITRPPPFHPNWFTSGQWCFGTWLYSESLGAHVIRMIQTLQFDEHITNE